MPARDMYSKGDEASQTPEAGSA